MKIILPIRRPKNIFCLLIGDTETCIVLIKNKLLQSKHFIFDKTYTKGDDTKIRNNIWDAIIMHNDIYIVANDEYNIPPFIRRLATDTKYIV